MVDGRLAPLYEWLDEPSFSRLADELQASAGYDFWARPRNNKHLQEALSVSAFARATGARRCRLVTPDPPDAEIEDTIGDIRRLEVTMVLTPGRRIADEYEAEKQHPSGPYLIGQEAMDDADTHWRRWLLERVGQKFERTSRFDDLLVYNNISNLFGAKGWETLPCQLEAIVPKNWPGRIWQHRSLELDQLWPEAIRLPIPPVLRDEA